MTSENQESLHQKFASSDSGPQEIYEKWPLISLALALILIGCACNIYEVHPRITPWFLFFWLHLPAILLLNTEQYALPGGYRQWVNQYLFKSQNSEFPYSKKLALQLNFPLLYILHITLALLACYHTWLGLILLTSTAIHSFQLTYESLRSRSYIPGAFIASLLCLPLTFFCLWTLLKEKAIEIPLLGLSLFLGSLIARVPFIILSRRIQKYPQLLKSS